MLVPHLPGHTASGMQDGPLAFGRGAAPAVLQPTPRCPAAHHTRGLPRAPVASASRRRLRSHRCEWSTRVRHGACALTQPTIEDQGAEACRAKFTGYSLYSRAGEETCHMFQAEPGIRRQQDGGARPPPRKRQGRTSTRSARAARERPGARPAPSAAPHPPDRHRGRPARPRIGCVL